jgi:hypothetical protein
MTVEILMWRLDMPALAKCTICLEEWRRRRGTSGKTDLERFTLEHLERHQQPRLFP